MTGGGQKKRLQNTYYVYECGTYVCFAVRAFSGYSQKNIFAIIHFCWAFDPTKWLFLHSVHTYAIYIPTNLAYRVEFFFLCPLDIFE